MANWLFLRGFRAFTAKCEIRYFDPLPIDTKVRLEGRCRNQKARLTQMEGMMIRQDTDAVVAQTDASFMMIHDKHLY